MRERPGGSREGLLPGAGGARLWREGGVMRKRFVRRLIDQRYLLLLSVPFVLWLIIFRYVPLTGWAMAFEDYKPQNGFFDQQWAGLKHFKALFAAPQFYQAIQNTLGMSFLGLVFGFTTSIGFAILLNELRVLRFKRFTQTVSYLPHFVSWVIVANIVTSLLSPTGPVNEMLVGAGILKEPYNFMIQKDLFWWVVVFADIWKETGWNAIIYLAAITGIDTAIYESAEVDGANRLQKIWYITLPLLRPTVIILTIMAVGKIMNADFGLFFNVTRDIPTLYPTVDVIDTYIYRALRKLGDVGMSSATGFFQSVVSFVLVLVSNKLANRIEEGSALF